MSNASTSLDTMRTVGNNPLNPNPWSKEWVFKGDEQANLKSLLGDKTDSNNPAGGDSSTVIGADMIRKILAQLPQGQSHASAVQGAGQRAGRAETAALTVDATDPRSALSGLSQAQLMSQLTTEVPGQGLAAALSTAPSGNAMSMQLMGSNAGSAMPGLVGAGDGEEDGIGATARTGASQLSGAEFLDTLGTVRGAQAGVGGAPGLQNAGANGRAPLRLVNPQVSGLTDARNGAGLKDLGNLGRPGIKGRGQGEEAAFDPLNVSGPGAFVVPGSHPGADTGPMTVTGHVVQGAMAKERLSSESLGGITTGLQSMINSGGGEMRIRMNPENLGELNMRVTTRGSVVGLQIQASDERAKKIIESSMGSLKDSLASQQLNLGRIELTVAPPAHGQGLADQQQLGNPQHGHGSELAGQAFNQQNQFGNQSQLNDGQGRSANRANEDESGNSRIGSARATAAWGAPGSRGVSQASSGRLDMMA